MSTSNEENRKRQASRPTGITENIHRVITWIPGVVGAFILVDIGSGRPPKRAAIAGFAAIFGAIVAVHAALAARARRRSGLAKSGSTGAGIRLLPGLPIGTVGGGFLICGAAPNWPPRHVGPAGFDMRLP